MVDVEKLVQDYKNSDFKDPYVFVEESGNDIVEEVLEKTSKVEKTDTLEELYRKGATEDGVRRQTEEEQEVFEDDYNREEELTAMLFFALVEVIQDQTI